MPSILSRLRGLQAPIALDEPLRLADAGGVKGGSGGGNIIIARNMRDVRRLTHRPPGGNNPTGVVAGVYTNANISVLADGRLSAASNGSGGGGGSGGNVTPDSHPSVPTGVGLGPNDEFETGSSIDTGGTRYSGATAWAWLNQGTTTALIGSQGALVMTGMTDGLPHSVIQPVPATPYAYTMKFAQWSSTTGSGTAPALILYNSSTSKLYLFSMNSSGSSAVVYAFTNPTTFSSTAAGPSSTVGLINLSTNNIQNWWYYRVGNTGTNLVFQISTTGIEGSWVTEFTLALSTFIGSVTHIGLTFNNNVASAVCMFDWFRRTT